MGSYKPVSKRERRLPTSHVLFFFFVSSVGSFFFFFVFVFISSIAYGTFNLSANVNSGVDLFLARKLGVSVLEMKRYVLPDDEESKKRSSFRERL